MGWHGKILRVNLTNGTCESEPLNMEWVRQYLGQRGLATKYLTTEIDPKVDPLSPDNKLIIATGPLTGTMASSGARWSAITKGALTGAIACSNSGGWFGAQLKMCGWDMIIFEGRAPNPVYLRVENEEAELLSAEELWGKSVWETEAHIKKVHQDTQIHIASIGVPGEKGVLFAGIVNDLHRAAGRSGVGAVMGSKNLKAIAVRGTRGVSVDDPKRFMEITTEKKKILAENPVTGQLLPGLGTNGIMNVMNESGIEPTRNFRDVQFEGVSKICGEAMVEPRKTDGKANLVQNEACFGCTIACGRVSKIDETHFSVVDKPEYWHASGGLEYENAWALGSDTGIDDLEALTFVNFLCNEQGVDVISFGATVAAAMELYEIGAITKEQTDGIELKFGNAKALIQITELMIKCEGFGKEVGLGSKRLCEKYGHPELSMTAKGQEFPAYDPRGTQGMALSYATSNRGGCHLRGYTISAEIFGIPEKVDPLTVEGKAGLNKAFQDAGAVVDSSGLCIFSTFAWTLEDIQPQIDAACAGDWSLERLLEVGERIWNLERQFNNAAGFTAKDDTLPPRLLLEGAKTGPAKGKVCELDKMLPEYYDLRGWTPDGVPTNETLERLHL
jgi:aldehyde:ferredoxin oxidoreductase